MDPRPKKTAMTDAHKKALAEGRAQSKAVRDYLEALEANRPKRGRKRTPDSIKKRLAAIEESLATAGITTRLHLVQEQQNLLTALAAMQVKVDLSGLEKAFVKHAKGYGLSKGIAYSSWRSVGVSAEVLRKAGITRAG